MKLLIVGRDLISIGKAFQSLVQQFTDVNKPLLVLDFMVLMVVGNPTGQGPVKGNHRLQGTEEVAGPNLQKWRHNSKWVRGHGTLEHFWNCMRSLKRHFLHYEGTFEKNITVLYRIFSQCIIIFMKYFGPNEIRLSYCISF